MKTYIATFKSKTGSTKKLEQEFESFDSAQRYFLNDEDSLIDLHEKKLGFKEAIAFFKALLAKIPFSHLSSKEVVFFIRELHTFVNAGIPIAKAIDAIEEYSPSRRTRKLCRKMSSKIKNGASLSDVLSDYPHTFSTFFIGSMRGAEKSGKIVESLKYNLDYYEWSNKTKAKFITVAAIPIVVGVIMIVMTYVLFFILLPKVVPFLERTGKDIPPLSMKLIALGDWLNLHYEPLKLGLSIMGSLILLVVMSKKGRYTIKKWMPKMPVIGRLIAQSHEMMFLKTFLLLYTSGLNIIDSLEICYAQSTNSPFGEAIKDAQNYVNQGDTFAEGVKKAALLSPSVIQMIQTAEKTGKLQSQFESLIEFYDMRIENLVNHLMNLVQPAYIIMVSGFIFLILIGFYIPIITISFP
jgi:type IV pilus assembly protein PilC